MDAKRRERKRLGWKRLGSETSRGGNGLGRNDSDSFIGYEIADVSLGISGFGFFHCFDGCVVDFWKYRVDYGLLFRLKTLHTIYLFESII